jgi:hypothetical protein
MLTNYRTLVGLKKMLSTQRRISVATNPVLLLMNEPSDRRFWCASET